MTLHHFASQRNESTVSHAHPQGDGASSPARQIEEINNEIRRLGREAAGLWHSGARGEAERRFRLIEQLVQRRVRLYNAAGVAAHHAEREQIGDDAKREAGPCP
jgi:hypothetical protein